MSDIIFKPYFEQQQQKAASYFAREHKEDFIADLMTNELNLINEAHIDIDALKRYETALLASESLSMTDVSLIAIHANNIQQKYKGLINMNAVVTESQDGFYRKSIVQEKLSDGAIKLIAALIAAVIAMIAWIFSKGKDKAASTSNATKANIEETKKILAEEPQKAKEKPVTANRNEPDNIVKKWAKEREENEARKKQQDKQLSDKQKAEKDAADEKRKQEIKDERDRLMAKREEEKRLGETAPDFKNFKSSSNFLNQFELNQDHKVLTFNELHFCYDRLVEYDCDAREIAVSVMEDAVATANKAEKILREFRMESLGSFGTVVDILTGKSTTADESDGRAVNKELIARMADITRVYNGATKRISKTRGVFASKLLKLEITYIENYLPVYISYKLEANPDASSKKVNFEIINDMTRFECYELNKLCEKHRTEKDSLAHFQGSARENLDYLLKSCNRTLMTIEKDITHNMKLLSDAKESRLKNPEGKDEITPSRIHELERIIAIVKTMITGIREAITFTEFLKTLSMNNTKQFSDFVKALAKNTVKYDPKPISSDS